MTRRIVQGLQRSIVCHGRTGRCVKPISSHGKEAAVDAHGRRLSERAA